MRGRSEQDTEGKRRDRSQEVGHRRFLRFPVSVPVVGQAAQFGDRALPGMVRNIGGGGVMADFPVLIAPGSVVSLTLQTRQGPLPAIGQVAWAGPPGTQVAHGIAFREPRGDEFAQDLFQGEPDRLNGVGGSEEFGPCPGP